eukprot:6864353-Alexandrium_andersonii.AAC.1
MSASLVGSEMCIRDSARGHSQGAPIARSASERGRTLCIHPLARVRGLEGCLLYTSDAADDM